MFGGERLAAEEARLLAVPEQDDDVVERALRTRRPSDVGGAEVVATIARAGGAEASGGSGSDGSAVDEEVLRFVHGRFPPEGS